MNLRQKMGLKLENPMIKKQLAKYAEDRELPLKKELDRAMVRYIITNFEAPVYQVENIDRFKKTLKSDSYEVLPLNFRKGLRLKVSRYTKKITLASTKRNMDEYIEAYMDGDENQLELEQIVPGYRIKKIFDEESVKDEVIAKLISFTRKLSGDVEHTFKENTADLITEAVNDACEELNIK